MIKQLLAVILAGCLLHAPVQASYSQFFSGNELYQFCTEFLKPDSDASKNDYAHLKCIYYVAGVYDSWSRMNLNPNICMPESPSLNQLTTVVTYFLRDNPQWWHKASPLLIQQSFEQAFECL